MALAGSRCYGDFRFPLWDPAAGSSYNKDLCIATSFGRWKWRSFVWWGITSLGRALCAAEWARMRIGPYFMRADPPQKAVDRLAFTCIVLLVLSVDPAVAGG